MGEMGRINLAPTAWPTMGTISTNPRTVERAEFGRSQMISGSGVVYWIIQMLVHASIVGSQSSIMTMGTSILRSMPAIITIPR